MTLVLTGCGEHTFTYEDEDGDEQIVSVKLGQDISSLKLPDEVVAHLLSLYWGKPRPRNMYYTVDEEAWTAGSPVVTQKVRKVSEIDPDDPGTELARQLAEEDRLAEQAERKKVAAEKKAATKKAATASKAATTKTKNGE